MRPLALYLATDHVLEIRPLTNGLTGEPITSATVTATLHDADTNQSVSGVTWPINLSHDGARPGRWYGPLPATLVVTDGQRLRCELVADAGAGLKRTWYLPVLAQRGGLS